jgi:hypothetical protein
MTSVATPRDWLLDAAELLAGPDPGPTPWLVEGLIVDEAILACVGRWKTTKSYGLLDICISVATGEPAFGALAIPKPGPVVYVCEESGRAALWRRLDALCRGRGIDPERLRGRLYVAANARVKVDDVSWQQELIALGREVEPRLFVFDPLARMKAAGREENAQREMSVVVEYFRTLRDETHAATGFVHHTGHDGGHMRGSSDLESVWESRLAWDRDGSIVTIRSEHREAEPYEPISYRIAWDNETRTMRFNLEETTPKPSAAERRRPEVVAYLEAHSSEKPSRSEVAKAIGGKRIDAFAAIKLLLDAGTIRDDGGLALVPVPGSLPKGRGNQGTGEASGSGNQREPVGNREPLSYDETGDLAAAAEVAFVEAV